MHFHLEGSISTETASDSGVSVLCLFSRSDHAAGDQDYTGTGLWVAPRDSLLSPKSLTSGGRKTDTPKNGQENIGLTCEIIGGHQGRYYSCCKRKY